MNIPSTSTAPSSADLRSTVRDEMRGVLSEMNRGYASPQHQGSSYMQPRANEAASSAFLSSSSSGSPTQQMRLRIRTLEDALSKSESDRSLAYAERERAERALSVIAEEKAALLHELHGSTTGTSDLTSLLASAQADNERLRLEHDELIALRQRVQDQDEELVTMRRQITTMRNGGGAIAAAPAATVMVADPLATVGTGSSNITLADLHYCNERLSAQLAKLQAPTAPPVFDEAKFRECEGAIVSLTDEVSRLENRIHEMNAAHQAEKLKLQGDLERQYRDFAVERAECDRIVATMSSKLEALLEEKRERGRGRSTSTGNSARPVPQKEVLARPTSQAARQQQPASATPATGRRNSAPNGSNNFDKHLVETPQQIHRDEADSGSGGWL